MHFKKHIPNTLTCCNLICGCISISCSCCAYIKWALIFIICGAIFDFFDGMVARLLHVSSPIGKELDSLADVVTFGVAPSFMLAVYLANTEFNGLQHHTPYLSAIAFVMAAFSALRLAKFNLDTRQSTSFIGLPTPANALFWGSVIVYHYHLNAPNPLLSPNEFIALIFMELVSCYLLVAELPLFALKFKDLSWKNNSIKYIFLVGCLPCFLLGWGCFAAIIVWYLALSILNNLTTKQ